MPSTAKPTFREELRLWRNGYTAVAGVDEVGRGAWAGPIVAAAVIFPHGARTIAGVRDSKQLTPKARERLFPLIIQSVRAWGIGSVSASVIDRIGIAEANRRAMRLALAHLRFSKKNVGGLEQLSCSPDYVLTDALSLSWRVSCRAVADGDGRVQSIAAASIIAKVWRDRLMMRMHVRHPLYGFYRHKGYGTRAHERALRQYGPCGIHRRSFIPARCIR